MTNIDTLSSNVIPAKDKAEKVVNDNNTEKYTGGKNLFTKLKNVLKKVAENTPALLTIGGGIVSVVGAAIANPALANAGALIMAAGYKALSDKNKSKGSTQLALSAHNNACHGR